MLDGAPDLQGRPALIAWLSDGRPRAAQSSGPWYPHLEHQCGGFAVLGGVGQQRYDRHVPQLMP